MRSGRGGGRSGSCASPGWTDCVRWESLAAAPDRIRVAQTLVTLSAQRGWSEAVMAEAAQAALGHQERWLEHFPHGPADAIWFISEVSDASMAERFATAGAASIGAVIDERLRQNRHLKHFVWKVMLFDLLHPVQALRRMDRTARVMVRCLARPPKAGGARVHLLNGIYTLLVFVWLLDRSPGDTITRRLTRLLTRPLRL